MAILGRFKSRKFQACAVAFAMASLFCWFGKITGGEWVGAAVALAGIYTAGNVAQKRGQLSVPPEAGP